MWNTGKLLQNWMDFVRIRKLEKVIVEPKEPIELKE